MTGLKTAEVISFCGNMYTKEIDAFTRAVRD